MSKRTASFLLLMLSPLLAIPAAGRAAGETSAYSKIDLDTCPIIEQVEEEAGWTVWQCEGYGGRPVYVSYGDERFSLGFARGDDWQSLAPFNSLGGTLEWRLADDGKPFATIIRYHTWLHDQREGQVLVVIQLEPRVCHIAIVDARSNADANELAREAADASAGTFRCGEDEVARYGRPGWSLGDF